MYDIKRYKSYRYRTRYIIIAHVVDLLKPGLYINPIVNRGTYKLTWDIWQKYWYLYQNKLDVPCHYYVELLNQDYVVFNGLAMQKRSYFLDELANAKLIDDKYRDSLLVLVGENFQYDYPEERLYQHIANRILSPMCFHYKINYETNVKSLDEILFKDWKEKLEESPLDYDIVPMKNWNDVLFIAYARPYMKLINYSENERVRKFI